MVEYTLGHFSAFICKWFFIDHYSTYFIVKSNMRWVYQCIRLILFFKLRLDQSRGKLFNPIINFIIGINIGRKDIPLSLDLLSRLQSIHGLRIQNYAFYLIDLVYVVMLFRCKIHWRSFPSINLVTNIYLQNQLFLVNWWKDLSCWNSTVKYQFTICESTPSSILILPLLWRWIIPSS